MLFGLQLKMVAFGFLCACATTSSATDQVRQTSTAAKSVAKKPFSATLVEYVKGKSDVKDKTRIFLSPTGMRTERLSVATEEPELIIIKNYLTKQVWLIDSVNNYYAELPRSKSEKIKPGGDGERQSSIGVLSNEPCHGMKAEKQSTRVVAGTELSVWYCMDSHDRQHLQHFSTLLGLVIREESQDGHISELQGIAFIDNSQQYFLPSNNMQKISIGELISGNLKLPEFTE